MKQTRQAVRTRTARLRQTLVEKSPDWARTRFGRSAAYLELMLVDHGIFRIFYLNRHRISEDAWRAAQPSPKDIRQFAREGVRTIVNLRGPRDCSSYALEREACAKHGIKLVDYQVRSRAAPTAAEVTGAKALFEEIEYPALMHCKSGADRAGLMSALFVHFHQRRPIEEAKRQLSFKFGHIRQAETGVLDYFFERYLEDNARRPMPFLEWVETAYDPDEVKSTFRAKGWANRLVNSILRRE
ncbi:MAG TPA: sulfur transferase domain-containing protein [Hyphomicrobiaceae bacterium]|nr:sulfur transferase domain-containing protein [Hyphomicrobiaceae bacterium]